MYFRIVKSGQGDLAAHDFKARDKIFDAASPQVREFTRNYIITCLGRSTTPMLFFRLNIYEFIAAAIFDLAYCGLRLSGGPSPPRFSYLAIFAALSVILNPLLIHLVLIRVHFPYIVGRGDSEFRSFAAGLVALIAGIVALVRIRKSKGELRGLPLAIIGIVGGALWAGAWAAFFLWFMWGMVHAGNGS